MFLCLRWAGWRSTLRQEVCYNVALRPYAFYVLTTKLGTRHGARRGPDRTTGPRDQASTPNGATGPPILERGRIDLSHAGDEARGQTRTRQDHGTTGPSQHTERGHRATDSGSWDHQSKPGWGRGTGPDGSQTGPRDHGTTRAHRTGPPGHRF